MAVFVLINHIFGVNNLKALNQKILKTFFSIFSSVFTFTRNKHDKLKEKQTEENIHNRVVQALMPRQLSIYPPNSGLAWRYEGETKTRKF